MKRFVISLSFAVMPGLASASDLIGTRWLTQGGQAEIAISTCSGGTLCGTVAKVKAPAGVVPKDTRNPDPAKRDNPLVGTRLIEGFKPGKDGKWVGGTIYNPNDGRSYRSELARRPDGKLAVKGCVGPVCQTQIWTEAAR
jgi:uncharacterized protein (DUF2147 family)